MHEYDAVDGRRARRSARRARARRRAGRRGRRAAPRRRGRSRAGTTSASAPAIRPRTPRSSRSRDAAARRGRLAARRLRARRHARAVPDVRGRRAARRASRSSCSAPPTRRPARSAASTTSAPTRACNHGIDVRRRRAGRRVGDAAQGVLRGRDAGRTIPYIAARRDARAAESDGLENHCGASHRGFKSHSLRHRGVRARSQPGPEPRLVLLGEGPSRRAVELEPDERFAAGDPRVVPRLDDVGVTRGRCPARCRLRARRACCRRPRCRRGAPGSSRSRRRA